MKTRRINLLVITLAASGFPGVSTHGGERSGPPFIVFHEDRLGESLKQFRSRHKDARCHRRPNKESNEKRLKEEWLIWVDCGLEKAIKLNGIDTLRESSSRLFGMSATFYNKKLAELTYTLAPQTLEELLPSLRGEFGRPTQTSLTKDDGVESVTWVGQTETLVLERVELCPVVVEQAFLRIGKGSGRQAVRVRVFLNGIPLSEP